MDELLSIIGMCLLILLLVAMGARKIIPHAPPIPQAGRRD